MMQRLFTMDRKAWPMDDDETQLLATTRSCSTLSSAHRSNLSSSVTTANNGNH